MNPPHMSKAYSIVEANMHDVLELLVVYNLNVISLNRESDACDVHFAIGVDTGPHGLGVDESELKFVIRCVC